MKPQLAKVLKDHYLNYYKQSDNHRLEEIDIKKSDYNKQYHINFLFNRTNSTLIITGDYGNAIFSWHSKNEKLSRINNYIKDNPNYFASKYIAGDQPCYIYDRKLAYKQIKDWLLKHNAQNLDWGNMDNDSLYIWNNMELFIHSLLLCFDYKTGFLLENIPWWSVSSPNDLKDALNYIDKNWTKNSCYWGRTINPQLKVWSHALNLGFRWHKQQLAKQKAKD